MHDVTGQAVVQDGRGNPGQKDTKHGRRRRSSVFMGSLPQAPAGNAGQAPSENRLESCGPAQRGQPGLVKIPEMERRQIQLPEAIEQCRQAKPSTDHADAVHEAPAIGNIDTEQAAWLEMLVAGRQREPDVGKVF